MGNAEQNRTWGRTWVLLAWLLLLPALACAKGQAGPVLVLGDSLSAAHNIPAGSGWVDLLQRRLSAQPGNAPRVVNASMSGETTAGALTRLPGLLAREKPGVVVIALGGNDALRGLSPAQIRANLAAMVQASQKTGAKVLVLGIDVPPNYGAAYRQRLAAVYREVSTTYKVPMLPFLLEGVALQPGMMQSDGLHPTAAAQPRVLENVWPLLRPLL